MNRRSFIAALGTGGVLGLSGCLGVAGLDEHVATPVGVGQDARDDTGYGLTGVDALTIAEQVGAAGYAEEIVVENYLAEHEKAVDMGPLGQQRGAVFVVLSTPQISILGQQVNPIEDKSTDELVELVAENYDGIHNVHHEGDDEVTILDQRVTESTFTADASFDGQNVEVNLHVTEAVATAADLVVAIGVYPQRLERFERDNVQTLMEAISTDAVDVGNADGENGGRSGGDDGGDGDDGDADSDDADDSSESDDGAEDGDGGDDDGSDDGETGDDEGGILGGVNSIST